MIAPFGGCDPVYRMGRFAVLLTSTPSGRAQLTFYDTKYPLQSIGDGLSHLKGQQTPGTYYLETIMQHGRNELWLELSQPDWVVPEHEMTKLQRWIYIVCDQALVLKRKEEEEAHAE